MNRIDDSGTGQKGPDDGQPESQDDEDDVPDFEHVAFFLDHHRMEEGGPGQPGHQRSIFNRIPGPKSSPSEFLIGPLTSKDQACRKDVPRKQSPTTGGENPFVIKFSTNQSPHGKSKWDAETDKPEIETRRMNRHRRMLKKRVQSPAFFGNYGLQFKGIRPSNQ